MKPNSWTVNRRDVIPAKAGIHFDFAFCFDLDFDFDLAFALKDLEQDQDGSQLSLG